MTKTFVIFLVYCNLILFGQNNFQKIDSIANSKKYHGNLYTLVNDLTQDFGSDLEKTRSIYSWITANIRYDYKLFNKGKRTITFKCKNQEDCSIKKQEFENNLIQGVLRKKRGICSGYSSLFKKMCDIAKIRCQIIDGFVKTKSYHIGNTGILDHSWNAVIIDNQTYFVDLTWAAGYCESNEKGKLTQFVQKKNDFYWFTPVEKFTVDHFPKNPEKIQDFQISKEDYRDQPYIAKEIVPFIEIQFPKQGILKPKIGDSINFSFKYPENIHKIQINTNLKRNPKFYFTNKNGESVFNQKAYLKQDYVDFQNINGLYRFSYFVENDELRYIEILFDYNLKMKYLVRIEN